MASDGSESSNDWQGWVPHDLLPHVINPARGWIGSGNHRPVASFYPIPLGPGKGHMGHTLRSWRLYERLLARDRFEPADVLDIHFDKVNSAKRDTVRIGLHLRDGLKRPLSDDATAALQQLEGWYQRGAKSDLTEDGGALAGEINSEFRPRGSPLAEKYGGGDPGCRMFLETVRARIAKNPQAEVSADEQRWIDNTLAAAWQSAKKHYGAEPAKWKEQAQARVKQIRRGYLDSLDGFGSLDPAHDLTTPALTCVDGSTINSQSSQSYTHYVPLHDVDTAQSLLPLGPSERPGNPWLEATRVWGRGCTPPLSRKAVTKSPAARRWSQVGCRTRSQARLGSETTVRLITLSPFSLGVESFSRFSLVGFVRPRRCGEGSLYPCLISRPSSAWPEPGTAFVGCQFQ